MRLVKWCAALVLIWTFPLCAQEQPPREQSALPWLELDALSATRDRPLFAPSRRKAVPPPVLKSKPEEAREVVQQSNKPQLALTGIIASSSSESIALLRDTSTSESIAVHSGETIGRWRVVINTDHSVKLQDGSDEIELEMFAEP